MEQLDLFGSYAAEQFPADLFKDKRLVKRGFHF